MNKRNLLLAGILFLAILLAIAPSALGTAPSANNKTNDMDVEISEEAAYNQAVYQGGQFSGDDLYDPAIVKARLISPRSSMNFSGDDQYDPAVHPLPVDKPQTGGVNFSGDDIYDPAAKADD